MAKGIGLHNGVDTSMTGILAIETATDACSVAVFLNGGYSERHVIAPRQHSQLLFTMLEELLQGGNLADNGIEVIAYGCGPGSIAFSASALLIFNWPSSQ